ncbi:MAG: hypothetical protein QW112_01325 [Candidatus Micrarchaeia archaeon]
MEFTGEKNKKTAGKSLNYSSPKDIIQKLGNKEKTEGLRLLDYASITDFVSIKIPLECGEAGRGDVYIYSHKDHLNEDFENLYTIGLKYQLENKKYILSEKARRDIGPVRTVARYIEDGDYSRFLSIFDILQSIEIAHRLFVEEEYGLFLSIFRKPITEQDRDEFMKNLSNLVVSRKLQSMEHIFMVHDYNTGRLYHIMPASGSYKQAFENIEQKGAMIYAVYKSFKDNIAEIAESDKYCDQIIYDWAFGNDEKNAKLLREALDESKIEELENDVDKHIYKNCFIFQDVPAKIKEKVGLL